MKCDKSAVVFPASVLQNAYQDFASCLAKTGDALATDFFVRIRGPNDHARDAHFQNQIRTGWGLAMVATGF
jgi:hypothetical protein